MPEKGTDTANTISDAACPSQTLSLFDRYHTIRGPQEARHDREEARTHAADIVAVLRAQLDPAQFAQAFVREFLREPLLGLRVLRIFHDFFREPTSPGFLVYEEQLAANIPAGRNVREELQREVQRSHRVVSLIFPIPEFYGLAAAIDDSCDVAVRFRTPCKTSYGCTSNASCEIASNQRPLYPGFEVPSKIPVLLANVSNEKEGGYWPRNGLPMSTKGCPSRLIPVTREPHIEVLFVRQEFAVLVTVATR